MKRGIPERRSETIFLEMEMSIMITVGISWRSGEGE